MLPGPRRWLAAVVGVCAAAALTARPAASRPQDGQHPVFKSGVDLVHVTVTVTDSQGHFVPGLRQQDFQVTEDGQPQQIVQFSAGRAPVSLGIALDTSSSMAGTKIREAREALRHIIDGFLEPDDEVFLFTFGDTPVLRQGWTTDRQALRRAVDGIAADGRTALYDTVNEALRLMQSGRYRKRVLLVVSDGNDTASFTPLADIRAGIRESETLVYAIGLESEEQRLRDGVRRAPGATPVRQIRPPQLPPAFPPRRPTGRPQPPQPPWTPPRQPPTPPPARDTANIAALRELTDISGGRTEVVRSSRDLGPATAGVADELSRQYQIVYQANTKRDGHWHSIHVTVRDASFQVRARRGYVA
jgi:VWFA-related protein